MPFRPELAQQHGVFHAGMISSIADTADATGMQPLMCPVGRAGVKD